MWARKRELVFAFVVIISAILVQPAALATVWAKIPIESFDNDSTGIAVLEVHEDYVTVDVSSADPDMIHIPIVITQEGYRVAKGTLRTPQMDQEVFLPLAQDTLGDDREVFILVLNQDWPQQGDELIIQLAEQDWPQFENAIIPLDFQDWPQNWLLTELV